ncbi:MAG: hypothetical protein CL432_09535 [Acidimicrobiaceae bacterium]|jgi:hypothetical protein|nr:hypothetical protein [Acidimicrobiaceae bacterium]|tara:strand:+ start:267 stop:1109 length:843 start_codon:yes stop_codon:yes gene_type:complete
MADKTIPALNTHESPTSEDLLIIVDDPIGNPVNKKIRLDNLLSALSTDTTTRSVANKVQSRADTNVARDLNLRNHPTVLQPEVLKGEQDDMTVILGTLDMAENSVWHVEIDGTSVSANDTFKWWRDGNTSTGATTVDITGGTQALANGISVKFDDVTGHKTTDRWQIVGLLESRIDFQGSLLIEDSVPDNGTFTSNFSETGNLQLESGMDMALEDGVEKDMYISANTTVMRFRGAMQIGSATDTVGFYGTAPVSQNTSFVAGASTAAHIITELTRLGIVS